MHMNQEKDRESGPFLCGKVPAVYGQEEDRRAGGSHDDAGIQQGGDAGEAQQLSADEVAKGAAQGVGGSDEGLSLHHVRLGHAAVGVV